MNDMMTSHKPEHAVYVRAFLRLLSVLLSAFLLSACGTQQVKMRSVMHDLDMHSDAKKALAKLNEKIPSKTSKDRVHYLINAAMLKQVSGDVRGSAQMFNEAKRTLESLEAISATETLGSLTLNDTVRSYVPSPSERLLIHAAQIQNYLALGELDSAHVETLQADQLLRTYRKDKNKNAQLASVYYLMGLVFELSGEWDDALIAYRHAKNQLNVVPKALQQALMSVAYQAGNDREFQDYVREFSPSKQALTAIKAQQGWATLVGIYWRGRSAEKISVEARVFSDQLGESVSLSLPAYRSAQNTFVYNGSLAQTAPAKEPHGVEQSLQWQVIESVNQRLEGDLSQALVGITTRMIARAVANHQVKKALKKQHGEKYGSALLALELFSLFIEKADTRGWSTLPESILVSRVRVPIGQESVALPVGKAWQFKRVSLESNQYCVVYKNDLAATQWFGHSYP